MERIKAERVIALLARRRGEFGTPEHKTLLEACRDERITALLCRTEATPLPRNR